MKTRLLYLVVLIFLLAAGCSAGTPSNAGMGQAGPNRPAPTSQANHPDAIKRDAFETYTASFDVTFNGPTPWKYQIILLKSGGLRELRYHVEGIQDQQALGDVRLVTDGTTSWMTGPGTDNACLQYPANAGLDPMFIYPENIVTMAELGKVAQFVREEPFAGRDSRYYLVGPMVVGQWKDASVEYHQEVGSEALLQFALLGTGEDTFFGTGSGTIMATYAVESLDNPTIEPVAGCEVNLPLPDSATGLVRMPGLVSYESSLSAQEIVQFYQQQLPQVNWVEVEPPAQSEAAVVLSYQREMETLEVQVEMNSSGGSSVKLFTDQK